MPSDSPRGLDISDGTKEEAMETETVTEERERQIEREEKEG